MHSTASATTPHTLSRVDPSEVDWAPWGMAGTEFKLLSADQETGRFTVLIKVDEGVSAPLHRHVKAVEVFILEGEFHYRDDPSVRFGRGVYLLEKDGAVHEPVSNPGCIMLATFHGPLEGVNADGEVLGTLDCEWHLNAWREAGHDVPA
ncbi:MAG: 2,4'-dihydroxyacetophenone dioxygenase family protein [Myxococcota bacterium]